MTNMTPKQAAMLWDVININGGMSALESAICVLQEWQYLPRVQGNESYDKPEDVQQALDFMTAWSNGLTAWMEYLRTIEKTKKAKKTKTEDREDEEPASEYATTGYGEQLQITTTLDP